jgi:hypothetical protein
MQHSIKYIGENYSNLSNLRKDEKRFNKDSFFDYASNNKDKYHLIDNGDDLLVSTWYSDDLIRDYKNTL